ncbi:T9SS C-terminal target domain-containing protein [Maribacter algicola]|uniref:T9SS C-terminal target domain-containing protein n=1 Tax=Maribacter algicola TaxID=2498892 RepID=A0A426RKA3_9FLAO|nr:T9SS type A sorting domain-containing protein [Maribacter algicola]RRQ49438.1 T9SS C-terminal target domain-containing protein [Maribacter algicola]
MKRIALLSICLFTNLLFSQQEGLDQNSSEKEVKVFPNPATNVINVLGLWNCKTASIIITDTYGNTLVGYQWEIKNKALNIPVANLEPGIYLLSIRSTEQNVHKKFVKQ